MADKDFQSVEDNIKTGYVRLYRSIIDHYIFKENKPFSKREAWIDILLKVNYKPCRIVISGVVFEIKRGETIRSLDTWASDWRWDKSKVRRFLTLLQSESMVCIHNEKISTRLTVCNYDSYQVEKHNPDTTTTQPRHNPDTTPTPNNKEEEGNKGNNDTLPNGSVVGLPSATTTKISFEDRCKKFIQTFNSIKLVNGNHSKYQVTSKVKEKLKPRLQKYKPEEIIKVIKNAMLDEHHIEKNFIYLTPEYVLREEVIERYLNANMSTNQQVYVPSDRESLEKTVYQTSYNPHDE